MALSTINQRRLKNFKANRRALWSFWIFSVLFVASLFAELFVNDRPLLIKYQGAYYTPIFKFYTGETFGDIGTKVEAYYDFEDSQCLIITGGLEECYDDPAGLIADAADGMIDGTSIDKGWIIWPLIPFSYDSIDEGVGGSAPSPPDSRHWLGTDDTKRDVLARVIYGFRLSVFFTLIVTALTSVIGILAGAVQGFFGGWTDLLFQRFIEIWAAIPTLYIIIIVAAIWRMNFWLLVALSVTFGWMGLVGVVRAEFLRARNFEYVRAARALGVSNFKIMIRHILPNAMVATLTFLPFIITGGISSLAALDFLGFGLPSSSPSLGELTQQAKQNLHMPHLAFSAFATFTIILSLMVFIFEGVRDAFDPRKTFS